MRVAFVESRDKTELFQAIAQKLHHDVHWLVQNAVFADASMEQLTVLPYPRTSDLVEAGGADELRQRILERVRSSDRARLYFGRDTSHYDWYFDRIVEWFDRVQPQVIFGEAGSFHSHIVALVADARGIPFLNPLSSRYPSGRFAFFESDRLVPVGGEGCDLAVVELERVVDDINHGRTRPDYMSVRRSRFGALRARLLLLREWFRGEKFTAQSPLVFAQSARRLKRSRERWDSAAVAVPELLASHRPAVLYPLQLQPEMNLDVWGREYRDQLDLMGRLADRLERDNLMLWVKPNPKSFYELSPALTEAAITHPNIRMIAHAVPMREVVDAVELVVTVSGSVAIERLLAAKPVATLQSDYAAWIGAPIPVDYDLTPETLGIDKIRDLLTAQSEIEPVDVVRRLISTSYRGVISEPSYMPGVLDDANVTRVASAFEHVIALVNLNHSSDVAHETNGDGQ